jgi:hypothetical protein
MIRCARKGLPCRPDRVVSIAIPEPDQLVLAVALADIDAISTVIPWIRPAIFTLLFSRIFRNKKGASLCSLEKI